MNRLLCLFLTHLFAAADWQLESEVDVAVKLLDGDRPLPYGVERVYRNTCLRCGDLVFRRVRTLE
jgi:hypothetical protein